MQHNQVDYSAFFNRNTFRGLRINFLVVSNIENQILYASSLDWQSGALQPIPVEVVQCFENLICPFILAQNDAPATGLLQTSQGVLMIATAPISSKNGGQFSRGALLIARYLDSYSLLELGDNIQLPLELVAMGGSSLNEDQRAARDYFREGHDYLIRESQGGYLSGYNLLKDVYGAPSFILQVSMARAGYQSGQFLATFLTLSLIASSSIFGLLTLILLETLVFRRLTRLEKDVSRIGSSGDASRRVPVTRKDEISSLSSNINQMLENLEMVQNRMTQLQTALQSRVDELAALQTASQTLLGQMDTSIILQSACRLAVERFFVDYAWIGYLSANQISLRPTHAFGIDLSSLRRLNPRGEDAHHPVVQAALTNTIQIQPITSTDENTSMIAIAAIPVRLGEKQPAVLVLTSREPDFFDEERIRPLQAFINLISTAYQNADLFEQVRAGRERLHALSLRLVEVQENERRNLALELHDEVGQILTGLKLMLETNDPQQYQNRLEQALSLVNELIGRVRQMSLDLRPAMLDDLGLLPTLLWHIQRYSQQTGIQIQLEHEQLEGQRFGAEVETTVYRVVQEALTNIARHAGVDHAVVRIWNQSDALGIQVEDQGAGFEVDSMIGGQTSGLAGMRERVFLLGGRFAIDASQGNGTCLTVFIPLPMNGKGNP